MGTLEGWDAFDVVRFHAVEELGALFRYEIVLQREAERGPVDIDGLVGTGTTFRIATEHRWRPVHGLITEAALVDQTDALLLYRVVLEPHAVMLVHRRRCRTFVDRSLVEVVEAALEGLSPLSGEPAAPAAEPAFGAFSEPAARLRWSLSDDARARGPRRFTVQYNETDHDFMCRLLEEEGLTFFFEHGDNESVLTITDRPGHAPLFARDARHELVGMGVGGASNHQEVVRTFQPRSRLRAANVVMRDYAWRKSRTRLEASAASNAPLQLQHFEFPARDEDTAPDPGAAPARFQLERFEIERHLSEGRSTVRTHEPGYRFRLADRTGLRDEQELLLVRAEIWAQQLFPEGTALDSEPFAGAPRSEAFHDVRFQVVPAALQFRPQRKTPKPEITGLQTARVTAEELGDDDGGVELNNDEMGRVRVRFPWDQREPDGTPSSKWVRVAHFWAGPGFGGMYVPRVGHEVLVAFERGDPDRPIIVGRLYNAQNPPPYMEVNTTKSTIKSDSVGADGSSADGFNEWRFDDAAGKEQIFLHAQRNLDEVVRANHTTTVGGDQSNTVGGNQTNTVYGNRNHHVHGTETVTVDGARETYFNATELHQVTSNRTTGIGGSDAHAVNVNHSVVVGGNQSIDVGANRTRAVGGFESVDVAGARTLSAGAQNVVIKASHIHAAALYSSTTRTVHAFTSPNFKVDSDAVVIKAGSAVLSMSSGLVTLTNGAGATISLCGSLISVTSGTVVDLTGTRNLHSGGATNMSAGGDINASAATIKLNG